MVAKIAVFFGLKSLYIYNLFISCVFLYILSLILAEYFTMRLAKQLLFLCFSLLFVADICGQLPNLNLTRTGGRAYPYELSSLWGYEAGGRKYALVGTTSGMSIVDISNPAAPVQIDTIVCTQSIWREVKTHGQYAYVVADNTSDGILIINLSNLPNSISHQFVRPQTLVGGNIDTLTKGHTLIFDENGILYVSGSNINSGAVVMFDVSSPMSPVYLGTTLPFYAHDCYARGDTLWTADINVGVFSVYNISNKAAPILLATQATPSNFTHNIWLSDDGQTLFTTDERADAWVAAYDVSDLSNIREIDRFRSRGAATTGVIPHNVHVRNDYLITAYYTDGVLVLDGSRPHNIIEVGRYDTYPVQQSGFFGVWGVYPYFSDGTIIASDMQTGLHIFSPNYQRACWLEGQITEQGSGNLIFGANVRILNTSVAELSDLNGDYATGLAAAGSYNVAITKAGYISQTVSVTLQNGILTTLNVVLVPATAFGYSGTVVEQGTSAPIAGAKVQMNSNNGLYSFQTTSNASGNFSFPAVYTDNYEITAGHWGHETILLTQQSISSTSAPLLLTLSRGYKDEFALDLGWQTSGDASSGGWERAIPRSPAVLNNQGLQITPAADLNGDIGNKCYVTGNSETGQAGAADVDNGTVVLRSPNMDLLAYTDPYLSFHYWFVNESGNTPDDTLKIIMTNGADSVRLAFYRGVNRAWSPQINLRIADFLPLSNNMHAYFITADLGNPNLVEAGIDAFAIIEAAALSVVPNAPNSTPLRAFPNPFAQSFSLELAANTQSVEVFNALGQRVERIAVPANTSLVNLGQNWASAAIYFVCPDGKNCIKVRKAE